MELLGCSRIDVRARGGQAAEIAVLLGLAERGDTVFYVDEIHGGHFGLTAMAQHCGIHLLPLPFDSNTHLIDLELLLHTMSSIWQNKTRKVMIVNQSFILRQQMWEEIILAIKSQFPDAIITCDASHLLGLIIGKQIINPLAHGIDILHASTHKTFPGPQKAIIIFNNDFPLDLENKVKQAISPLLQSSCGTAEIIALAVTFCEMKVYAMEYATAVCQNAKVLAHSLVESNISVTGEAFDFTQTHQCWVPIGSESDTWKCYALLHAAGLRALPGWLPFIGKWGIRFGVNALTRRGMQAREFILLAEWIASLLTSKVSPEKIKLKTEELASQFPLSKLSYTFDNSAQLSTREVVSAC